MQKPLLPRPPVPGGFGFPLGFVTAVVVTSVAAGETTRPQWSVAALACATAAIACVTTLAASVGTAATAWALHAGFVVGRHGDLVFSPGTVRAAIVLLAATLLAFIMAAVVMSTVDVHWGHAESRR